MNDPRRFWSRVDPSGGPSDCWEWRGDRGRTGYGRFHFAGKKHYAHRLAFEWIIGPIPDGLVIDHLCRNPPCVNPAHMQPVTNGENVMRGESPYAKRARQASCKRGHPFDEANTYRAPDGRRRCRRCHAATERQRRATSK